MEHDDEIHEKKKKKEDELERHEDPEEQQREQERHREEIGEETLEKIKKMVYERYPDMVDIEPLIQDEGTDRLPGNIFQRLKQLATTDEVVDDLEKAWKSLLFQSSITRDELELIKRIIAIINKRGDLLRIDESSGREDGTVKDDSVK